MEIKAKPIPIDQSFQKIGIIDADLLDGGTNFPNLALMKISGYYKDLGGEVKLIEKITPTLTNEYDAIFVSKVFDYTSLDENLLRQDKVYFGGTGFFYDKAESLPREIEHHRPDYYLYDNYSGKLSSNYTDYSIGFTTRGCFRGCEFCVNQNCKKVEFHSHVEEWLDPKRKYICLLDDNILGYSNWEEVLSELQETGKRFLFKEGLDIRVLTKEKARILSECKYHGGFIFAFDDIKDQDLIIDKLKIWRDHCSKETRFYTLTCFEKQDETEVISLFERIKILSQFKCFPYVMRHKNYLGSKIEKIIIQMARWCNMPQFLKKLSFREFCELDQSYKKTDRVCASMKALNDFEQKYPEIAKQYFDIRFYEQNT